MCQLRFFVFANSHAGFPASIYELAKILNRNLKNVLQDVEYLKELGIVEIEEAVDKKIPHVYYDRVDLQIAV